MNSSRPAPLGPPQPPANNSHNNPYPPQPYPDPRGPAPFSAPYGPSFQAPPSQFGPGYSQMPPNNNRHGRGGHRDNGPRGRPNFGGADKMRHRKHGHGHGHNDHTPKVDGSSSGKKKKRKTNTLGLTPGDDSGSEQEAEDDEEARLQKLLGPNTLQSVHSVPKPPGIPPPPEKHRLTVI